MESLKDLGGVVEWQPGCVVQQNGKTKTLHLLPKGSTDSFEGARLIMKLQSSVVASRPLNGGANNVTEGNQSIIWMV